MAITLNGTTGIISPKVNALDLELDSNNSASLRSLDVTSGSVATRISALTPPVSAIGRWY